MRAALSALLAALTEGAGGDAGRVLAEAAEGSWRPEALRAWGDRVRALLGGDPRVAGAVAAAMERHAPGSADAWYGGDHSDFRGGVFLREVVGVQVVVQQGGAATAPEALASLPPRPGGFTGREQETAELLRALDFTRATLGTTSAWHCERLARQHRRSRLMSALATCTGLSATLTGRARRG
ncbi:hypothetical protein ABZ372_04380 [Streptomyces sp. NPDC005921]|uniref:hypothetical protein n=1 Tax=Streptomyces sp. NPDC005827 TaxID=3157070 RepID=UPI0033D2B053